jgi:hypothetical protein
MSMKAPLFLLGVIALVTLAPTASASCPQPGLTLCTTPEQCAPGSQCCLVQCDTTGPIAFLPQKLLQCSASVAGQAATFGGTAANYAVGLVFGC